MVLVYAGTKERLSVIHYIWAYSNIAKAFDFAGPWSRRTVFINSAKWFAISPQKCSIVLFRLPALLFQMIWVRWPLFGIHGNWAWIAMLWSRSSIGRRPVHIVSRGVEERLIMGMVGEVKKMSSWRDPMCQVYLIQVARVGMKYWEY